MSWKKNLELLLISFVLTVIIGSAVVGALIVALVVCSV